MDYQIAQSARRRAWGLARQQWDVISRAQLLEIGWHSQSIKHRLTTGRLHPMWRGVYAVGRPTVSQLGWWMGALLACGDGAVLSHHSAAALWGISEPRRGPIHVSTPLEAVRRRPGIRAHRRTAMCPRELTTHKRIRVTSVATTLVDVALLMSREELEAAVNQADKLNLIDPETLRRRLDELGRRPGVGSLRSMLDRRTFTLTDSELERRFLPIARRAGLPLPEAQAYVSGFRVDFYWPTLGLVVETDGLRYHRTAAQQARDHLRDQAHARAGLTPLRFTRAQVHFEPKHVEATLAMVARRLHGHAR